MADRVYWRALWRGFWEGVNLLFWLAWALYGIGHASYIIYHWRLESERWRTFWFRLYQWGMCSSLAVQERYGFSSPWYHRPYKTNGGELPKEG